MYLSRYVQGNIARSSLNICMTHLARFGGAPQMMANKIGKEDAVRNAAIWTNVHLGEPEEPIGFGLSVAPLRLRVRTRSSLRSATRCALLTCGPRGVCVYYLQSSALSTEPLHGIVVFRTGTLLGFNIQELP
ncbi:hypothetical protein DEU56DRAFT_371202 [Suillus clintonianus]|uniref:uncharacterized protein n=1 Tax=Suillus clintonianus TaxID=1904413 RepID=UPI001B884A39|nr:uncharacterized protein DEU56DRAFT_371202 [Suillus clintonianus]KAG2154615.1 hypothetical protein DEU56DRAFT_371202 [Suillus clintonianus]